MNGPQTQRAKRPKIRENPLLFFLLRALQVAEDDLPPSFSTCFAKRTMLDDFVTSDMHPSIRFLLQLHLARGTLTWEELVHDNAFVLLGQASQPIVDTLSAINAWCLCSTGDRTATSTHHAARARTDERFTVELGFMPCASLASWLSRARQLAYGRTQKVLAGWFPTVAGEVGALPTAGVHPIGLLGAADFRTQPHTPLVDVDPLLHE